MALPVPARHPQRRALSLGVRVCKMGMTGPFAGRPSGRGAPTWHRVSRFKPALHRPSPRFPERDRGRGNARCGRADRSPGPGLALTGERGEHRHLWPTARPGLLSPACPGCLSPSGDGQQANTAPQAGSSRQRWGTGKQKPMGSRSQLQPGPRRGQKEPHPRGPRELSPDHREDGGLETGTNSSSP